MNALAALLLALSLTGPARPQRSPTFTPTLDKIYVDEVIDLPDAPSPQVESLPPSFRDSQGTWMQLQEVPPRPTDFWSFGKWNAKQSLRTNRETLRSPWFWAPEAAGWAACSVDARVNRNSANVPRGKELWFDACVPMMISPPLHFVLDRFMSRPLGLAFPAMVIFRHTRGAVTGNYP